jgi:hypothetical protein
MEKVTLYTVSEMMGNVIKREIKMTSLEYKEYAQYKSLLHVQGIPKGKRTEYVWRSQGRYAFFVVVEGWGHPEPASMFGTPTRCPSTGLMVSESSYSSHDAGYIKDFMKANWSNLQHYLLKYDISPEYLEVA